MRLLLISVGRLKRGPEEDLVARYRSRIESIGRANGITTFDIAEIPEGRGRSATERQHEEATAILSRVGLSKLVAFDERGSSLSSTGFADQVGAWRDDGAALACVIGGPDGLHPDLRSRADLVLAFGRLTLPHQLVRVLVVEQLYRGLTILSGHPYHRGDGA